MADIELTIRIPDAYITRTIDAFTGVAGARIDLMAHNPETEFNANWNFTISPKDDAEPLKSFGERFLRELGLAVIRMWDYAEDQDRYRTAVSTIPSAAQDVPDDILT